MYEYLFSDLIHIRLFRSSKEKSGLELLKRLVTKHITRSNNKTCSKNPQTQRLECKILSKWSENTRKF